MKMIDRLFGKHTLMLSFLTLATANTLVVQASDIDCEEGTLIVDLTVNEGESCTIVENIDLNGTLFRAEFDLKASQMKIITIDEGTILNSEIVQSCAIGEVNKVSTLALDSALGCGVAVDEDIDEEEVVDDEGNVDEEDVIYVEDISNDELYEVVDDVDQVEPIEDANEDDGEAVDEGGNDEVSAVDDGDAGADEVDEKAAKMAAKMAAKSAKRAEKDAARAAMRAARAQENAEEAAEVAAEAAAKAAEKGSPRSQRMAEKAAQKAAEAEQKAAEAAELAASLQATAEELRALVGQ